MSNNHHISHTANMRQNVPISGLAGIPQEEMHPPGPKGMPFQAAKFWPIRATNCGFSRIGRLPRSHRPDMNE